MRTTAFVSVALVVVSGCAGAENRAIDLSAGGAHTCAVSRGGSVLCWGQNAFGQLGDGTTVNRLTAVEVTNISGAVSVAAGGSHSCAVLDTGEVRCWGRDAFGQLGDGGSEARSRPVVVEGLDSAAAVVAGEAHTCALRVGGELYCWGSNAFGQLGIAGEGDRPRPTRVPLTGVINVAAGDRHTCALLHSGAMLCWGASEDGRLGNPVAVPVQRAPVPVDDLADAAGLAVGKEHSCALRRNGNVACWGSNRQGQLADFELGPVGTRSTPEDIEGVSGALSLAAGALHTCVLVGRVVECWGGNAGGQLGDGTTQLSLIPLPVAGVEDAVLVRAGRDHTCALRMDGRVSCWGFNGSGQLGEGTGLDQPYPTDVVMP